MVGERTWTSAMSGAATNTVEAGPGSLSAVPLLTSSVSVGGSVGTTVLWANGRPAAPATGGGLAGWAGGLVVGGWIGTGAGGVGACANCGGGAAGVRSTVDGATGVGGAIAGDGGVSPTSGVSDARMIGARGGMAATVGGRLSAGDFVSVAVTV